MNREVFGAVLGVALGLFGGYFGIVALGLDPLAAAIVTGLLALILSGGFLCGCLLVAIVKTAVWVWQAWPVAAWNRREGA